MTWHKGPIYHPFQLFGNALIPTDCLCFSKLASKVVEQPPPCTLEEIPAHEDSKEPTETSRSDFESSVLLLVEAPHGAKDTAADLLRDRDVSTAGGSRLLSVVSQRCE